MIEKSTQCGKFKADVEQLHPLIVVHLDGPVLARSSRLLGHDHHFRTFLSECFPKRRSFIPRVLKNLGFTRT